jgi:hypothetical protein
MTADVPAAVLALFCAFSAAGWAHILAVLAEALW